MGKVTSLYGKTQGKIGSIVFSTSGGYTIAREYNPHVANPNTMAQINQRARMKLMSQLSASLAPVIAIPKKGNVSSRNQFTKMNFGLSMAEQGIAQISYENIQLTNGNLGLPTIQAVRAPESGITINLDNSASQSVNRVVYILYRKTAEQRLQFVTSVIAENAGTNGTYPATLPYVEGDIVLYAYGMRDTSESASAKYGNMQVASALDVARLTAYRNISTEDFQFTQTRGATMYAGQNELVQVPEGSARVFVTAFGFGSVSGSGVYELGSEVTVVATPQSGYVFIGWRDNSTQELISTDATYTFTLNGQTDLVAMFSAELPGSTVQIYARMNKIAIDGGATIKIGEQTGTSIRINANAGDNVTIQTIPPTEGNIEFVQWQLTGSNEPLATTETYTFIAQSNMDIVAVYKQETI